jgi:NAD(P)-dependent dehydrogenase (short-subunit alcohol dehydrogenase family)
MSASRVVIVTGAGGVGSGRAIARRFAAGGRPWWGQTSTGLAVWRRSDAEPRFISGGDRGYQELEDSSLRLVDALGDE